jgi:putative phosphotransacetylase
MANTLERALVENIVRQVVMEKARTPLSKGAGRVTGPSPLVVSTSARHCHLKPEDIEKLFGPGYKLTPFRDLYQAGQFAAKETVTLIGPKSRTISNLRILGPSRDYSQVELAYTDSITLGIENVPVRLSGDIKGTPGCYLMGPAGMLELKEGVIRAAPHAHMSEEDARGYGVKPKDLIALRVGGQAGVVFDHVHVRVDKSFRLEVHLDTDEANACGLHATKEVELIKAR